MNQLKKLIALQFNKAVNKYDESSYVQCEIGSELISLLMQYQQEFYCAVDLGCGTGLTTCDLIKYCSCHQLFAIDMAASLLRRVNANITTHSTHVHAIQADYDEIPLQDEIADLVFSNMALQWSLNYKLTFAEILRVLKFDGLLAFTIPLKGTFSDLFEANVKINPKFVNNSFMTLDMVKHYMQDFGIEIMDLQTKKFTYRYPSILELLKSLKNTGSNTALYTNRDFVLGRKYLEKLKSIYPVDEFRQCSLSYYLAIIIGRKKS